MTEKNSFGVVVGQFQPFTNVHYELIRFALKKVETVIVVLGSHFQARTIKVPWSTPERIAMIQSCFSTNDQYRLRFAPAKDYLYNENLWIVSIQAMVDEITNGSKDVLLLGHKDSVNHYSSMFPQWRFIDADDHVSDVVGNAPTSEKVREMFFTLNLLDIKRHVPAAVFDILKSDMMAEATRPNPAFMSLKDEFEFLRDYKSQWDGVPFPPTFETVDAVTLKSGHILVVRRKGTPGKGLIALPGGFLNQHERLVDAAVRELKEETAIKLTKAELMLSLRDKEVFDHPSRSLRGRTITHAYCFNLGQGELPKVRGEDDADKAWWMSLRDVFASEDKFFEDHFHIINHFVNKY